MSNKIKILIADDHTVVRAGLKAILGFEKDFAVVCEAANGLDAVKRAAELKPDVVIMDLMMPKLGGAEATAQITSADPNVRVIILTTYGSAEDISRALDAGATGALMKTASDELLANTIRKIAAGGRFLSAEIAKSIKMSPPVVDLTPRQLEILQSVTRGLTNEDIATQFGITSSGVKQHLSTVFAKLGASSRSEAVAIALRKQLLKA